MKSIMTTYPDFPALPREIRRFLLASESYYFEEIKTLPQVAVKAAFSAAKLLNPNPSPFSGLRPGGTEWNAARI